jgi:hypothetical protein
MLHASQLQRYIEMIKIKIFIVPTKLKLLIFIPLFISIGIKMNRPAASSGVSRLA